MPFNSNKNLFSLLLSFNILLWSSQIINHFNPTFENMIHVRCVDIIKKLLELTLYKWISRKNSYRKENKFTLLTVEIAMIVKIRCFWPIDANLVPLTTFSLHSHFFTMQISDQISLKRFIFHLNWSWNITFTNYKLVTCTCKKF